MSARLAEALETLATALGSLAERDAPLGARTTYRVGGTAALYVEVAGRAELEVVVGALAASPVEVLVLGRGSNLLVADGGFAGVCVSLAGDFEQVRIEAEEGLVHGGGALAYPVLARRCAAAGLAGMSWAVGIPGSVGGAVAMNAGGHGAATAERLVAAEVVDLRSGTKRRETRAGLELSYRHSALGPAELVVEATYALEAGERAALEAEVDAVVTWRRENQPGGRNGGSVFTNPIGDSAGRIIEEAGLKGLRVGGAVVSEKHANFIQADPDSTADDVYRLIGEVQRLVAARLAVELVPELRLVGFTR